MTRARDLANLIADGKVGATELDSTASYSMGGLTVDTNTLHVDTSNNRIGINRTDPEATIEATGTDTRMIRLTSTNGSSGLAGPYITLFRDSQFIASGERIGAVYFVGVPQGVQTQSTYAAIEATIVSHVTQDGQLEFKIEKSSSPRRALTLNNTEAVFNQDAQNIDFRIESQNDDDLFKVDASADQVSIADIDITAGNIKTNSDALSIDVDADGTYSSSGDKYFSVQFGGVNVFSVEDDDVYVRDNISSGRMHNSGTDTTYITSHSHVSAYTAESADGTGDIHRTFIQSRGDTSDPELAVFQAHTRDVRDDTGLTGPTMSRLSTAHLMDQAGRAWSWNTVFAGRVREGTTSSTSSYRAADNGYIAYSGTGNTHGATSSAGHTQVFGRESPNSDDVFLSTSGGSPRIEFDASGNGYFDGGADLGNADYAEYFEWADGNPKNEDRRGYPVALTTDGKIKIATAEDDASDFLGIVSVEAAIVGDSAWAHWTGMHERDKFGQQVYEDYELLVWGEYDEEAKSYKTQTTRKAMIDAGREKDIPADAKTITKQRKKVSADYDPSKTYIPRKDRPEWQAIGLMGKLPLLKGQPTAPQWKKLFDLNSEVEMWLVR